MAASMNWRDCLNDIELFDKIRKGDSIKGKTPESKNIIATHNGEIFVWCSKQACIMTKNLKNLAVETETDRRSSATSSSYQTFVCSDPPAFEVTNLRLSLTGQFLALIGPRGISVMLIPRKWGPHAAFEGGKSRITCKTVSIDEHLFASYGRLVVLEARWHPGSASDSHLVVLASDNTLRLYNVMEPVKPEQVIPLGQAKGTFSLPLSKPSIAAALGANVISFDFGPHAEQLESSKEIQVFDWPVFVLQANGDVYIMNLDVDSPRERSLVEGPLAMYPAADDNYGTDACSLLCLPTRPAVLVIAESTGKLYHCVVLNSSDDEPETARSEKSWTGSSSIFASDAPYSLHVFEKVELELALTRPSLDFLDQQEFTCPIILHADCVCKERYHCSHTAGIHTVALPWINKMQLFCDDETSDSYLRGVLGADAIVEHLICTKPLADSPDSPIAGLCIVSDSLLGNTLLCLTEQVECIALPLLASLNSETPPLLSSSSGKAVASPLRKVHREPFQDRIRKILQRSTSNPILRTKPDTSMTQQQCFQLLMRTTQIFRQEYIEKQNLAQEEIERRASILEDLKKQQQSDVGDFQASKNQLRERAGELAEKYEECCDEQQCLQDRLYKVLYNLQQSMPVLSNAERNMQKELKSIQDNLDAFTKSLDQIKAKREYQAKHMAHTKKSSVSGSTISSKQSVRLSHVLKEEGDQISELVKQVKSLSVAIEENV